MTVLGRIKVAYFSNPGNGLLLLIVLGYSMTNVVLGYNITFVTLRLTDSIRLQYGSLNGNCTHFIPVTLLLVSYDLPGLC